MCPLAARIACSCVSHSSLYTASTLKLLKKLSIGALSYQSPLRLMLCKTQQSSRRFRNALLANCEPRSEWVSSLALHQVREFGQLRAIASCGDIRATVGLRRRLNASQSSFMIRQDGRKAPSVRTSMAVKTPSRIHDPTLHGLTPIDFAN